MPERPPNLTPEQPKSPIEIIKSMQQNQALGDSMDILQLLSDIQRLEEMGVADRVKDFIITPFGKNPAVGRTLLNRIQDDDQRQEPEVVFKDIRLAYLLGLGEIPQVAVVLSKLAEKYEPPGRTGITPAQAERETQARLAEVRAELQEVQEKEAGEDVPRLSLEQLQERAHSLTPEQLSQVPPFKLALLIQDGHLTGGQILSLPIDSTTEQAMKDFQVQEIYQLAAKINPAVLTEKINISQITDMMNGLLEKWKAYQNAGKRPVWGGLIRLVSKAPTNISEWELTNKLKLIKDLNEAVTTYSNNVHAPWLIRLENKVARGETLADDDLGGKKHGWSYGGEGKWPDLKKSVASAIDTFPLLADYLQQLIQQDPDESGQARLRKKSWHPVEPAAPLVTSASSEKPSAPPETAPLPEAPALFGEGSPFVTIRGEGWEEDEKLSEEMKESLEQQRKKDRSGITGEVEFVEYQEKGRSPAGLGRWIPTRSDLAADFANMPIGQWIREPQPDSQLAIKVARGDPQAEGQLAAERWALFNLQTLFEDDDPARPPRILGFGMASVESLERKPRAYLILEKIGPPFENLEDYLKKTGGKLPEKEVLEIAIGLAHILMKAHQRGIMNNDTNDLKLRDSFWDPIGKRLRQIDWGNASNQNVDMGFVQKRSYYHDREGFTRLLLGLLTGDMVSVDAKRITPPPEISQTTREIIERVYLKPNYGPHSSPEGTAQMYIDLMIAYRQLTGQPIDTARYYQQRLDEQLTRLTLINSYDSVKQNPPTDPALQKIWKEIDFNVRAAENDRMAIEKYGSAIAYVLANTKNGYWSLFDTALNTIYASPTEVNVATLAPTPKPETFAQLPAQPETPLSDAEIGQQITLWAQQKGVPLEQAYTAFEAAANSGEPLSLTALDEALEKLKQEGGG